MAYDEYLIEIWHAIEYAIKMIDFGKSCAIVVYKHVTAKKIAVISQENCIQKGGYMTTSHAQRILVMLKIEERARLRERRRVIWGSGGHIYVAGHLVFMYTRVLADNG
ncbi:hypothetical protein ACJX0J_006846, partial [Zea mays]